MNRDPEGAPGVAGTPVPAGISLHHMDKAMRAAFGGLRVRAVTLAVYDPEHDRDDKTLRTALPLIELRADGARAQDHEDQNTGPAERFLSMTQQFNVVSVQSTQSTCAVRPAQTCDCEAMADLAGQLGYECSGEQVRKRLRDMQDSKQCAVLVAELPERQIAGWIGASLFRSIETGSCVEINGLVVDQGTRSRGIGKILLSAAEEWARSIGFDVISVHSNVTRDRAHRFYLRNGYAHVKTQKEFHKSL